MATHRTGTATFQDSRIASCSGMKLDHSDCNPSDCRVGLIAQAGRLGVETPARLDACFSFLTHSRGLNAF
jgi:hypothetical protein